MAKNVSYFVFLWQLIIKEIKKEMKEIFAFAFGDICCSFLFLLPLVQLCKDKKVNSKKKLKTGSLNVKEKQIKSVQIERPIKELINKVSRRFDYLCFCGSINNQ